MSDHKAHIHLLSAVVARAITDSCLASFVLPGKTLKDKVTIKGKVTKGKVTKDRLELHHHAVTAMNFLLTNSSDGYLELLDYDPPQFRIRMIEKMHSDEKSDLYKDAAKVNFRENYKLWLKLSRGKKIAADALEMTNEQN